VPGGRRDGGCLHLRVHRRDDRQPTGLEQRLPAGLVRPEPHVGEQLVQDVVAEVAVGPGAAGRRATGVETERSGDGRLVLLCSDVPELEHAVEHDVAALDRVFGRVGRVERRGVLDDAGQQRRLRQRQLGRRRAEVALGSRLDAVRAVAEEDEVEVALEDLVLAHRVGELEGVARLLELAGVADLEDLLALGLGPGLRSAGS
jgi:hypothetical protein